eukprot:762047-Pelagomonas_calceolata.AAC.5
MPCASEAVLHTSNISEVVGSLDFPGCLWRTDKGASHMRPAAVKCSSPAVQSLGTLSRVFVKPQADTGAASMCCRGEGSAWDSGSIADAQWRQVPLFLTRLSHAGVLPTA